MATKTKLLTAEEFWDYPSSQNHEWELIDGVPVETMPPALDATAVAATITGLIFCVRASAQSGDGTH